MKNLCALAKIPPGQWAKIHVIPDAAARMRAMSLGIGEGSMILCVTHLRKGPSIVLFGRQKIAFGSALASRILTERISSYE